MKIEESELYAVTAGGGDACAVVATRKRMLQSPNTGHLDQTCTNDAIWCAGSIYCGNLSRRWCGFTQSVRGLAPQYVRCIARCKVLGRDTWTLLDLVGVAWVH